MPRYIQFNPVSYSDPSGYCRVRFDGVVLQECDNLTCPDRTSLPPITQKYISDTITSDNVQAFIVLAVKFKIDQYKILIHGPHSDVPNSQRHIHIIDGKREYIQNNDGTTHDEGRSGGDPPNSLKKKLKDRSKNSWDWDGNAEKQNNKNKVPKIEIPKYGFNNDFRSSFFWERNYEPSWATGDETFWDIINPFKKR